MKPMSDTYNSRRSMVLARRGMVSASNPLAAQSGLNVLRMGGNAADAAIATAAVLNVTDPASTGIGGDCFSLFYDASAKKISALNGSGRAPNAIKPEDLRAEGIVKIPARCAHAVTVPGALMGWHDLLTRHGTMTLSEVLIDAIHYAHDGFPVSPITSEAWNDPAIQILLKDSPNADEYLPNGSAPRTGQLIRLPQLAHTLKIIAEEGPNAFYTGPIAEAIVSTVQEQGGVLTIDDLRSHHSTWHEPIRTNYRGITVCECPPNGQGLAALEALNIAEGWELGGMAWDSPERLHLMVEAMQLSFIDAYQYIADMSTNSVPVNTLLSKDYAAQRRDLVSSKCVTKHRFSGLLPSNSNTVYFCVVDSDGNACSFINSLYMSFGSGIVAKGTGIILQNRGANFSLDPRHPNVLAPGKRPYHTIIPGMALKDGDLWASFGMMGGFMQPQGHFQMISAMVDDYLNPQDALNRPRFCLIMSEDETSTLALEEGFPIETIARLAEFGHIVRPVVGANRDLFGGGHIIRRHEETGVLYGGSDPRQDGLVAAF